LLYIETKVLKPKQHLSSRQWSRSWGCSLHSLSKILLEKIE